MHFPTARPESLSSSMPAAVRRSFNLESGYTSGEVTTRRNGGAIIRVKVKGKAAHAGKEPQKGASAILQAARMITEIESRSVFGYLSFNCGRISGGTGANVIPDSCEFSIGIRYAANAQYEEAIAFLKNLCEHVTVPGTSCTMEQNGYYPAMEMVDGADRLLSLYQESCKLLGEPIPQGIQQSGCSDTSFVTRIGIPASAASVSRAQAHIHLMSMRFRPHCSCSARNWWSRFWRCKMLCGS